MSNHRLLSTFSLVLSAALALAGCEADSVASGGAADDEVVSACEGLCVDLEGCPVLGGDGCQEACEDASDECRSCLEKSESCGDGCAEACAEELGTSEPDPEEPSGPATCDPSRCAAYCEAGGACEPYVTVTECVSRCESVCGDGTFERSDVEVMECVLGADAPAMCTTLEACCGTGDDKSASDLCI